MHSTNVQIEANHALVARSNQLDWVPAHIYSTSISIRHYSVPWAVIRCCAAARSIIYCSQQSVK